MAELLAAFLRGVNVNGNQIRMAALKEAFEGMGFTGVRTVLGTGNVVFTADPSAGEPKPRIEHALYAAFGYDAPVYLRTATELVRLREHARAIPVPEGFHLYLLLCGDAALPAELAVLFAASHGGTEEFYPAGADAFWVVPKGETLTSPFGSKALGAKLYRARLTSRNWRTVEKVLEQMGEPA